jgi:choline kinase
MSVSTTTTIQAEASKPQKKMQECNRCKAAGFPNQLIGFEKIGEDPVTGKINWKLIDENGEQHKHKSNNQDDYSSSNRNEKPVSQRRRVVDISTVTDVEEARKLLSSGWEYKTSYAATIANIPHYVLVKRE